MTESPRLTRAELRIMETLWAGAPLSIREIQQSLPAKSRPVYTTVQTLVYRLEAKKALHRVKKISNADIFAPLVSRTVAHRRLIDEFLGLFGGAQPVMARLIETGRLSLQDIQEAEQAVRRLSDKARRS